LFKILGRHVKAQIGPDGVQFANNTLLQQVKRFLYTRNEETPECFHQENPVSAGRFNHAPGLGGIHRKRLLAQHGKAIFQTHQRIFAVINVRCSHINGIKALARQQILVAPVRVLCAVLARERTRAIRRCGRHRVQTGTRYQFQIVSKLAGNTAHSDNSPVHVSVLFYSEQIYAIEHRIPLFRIQKGAF
jgi:hypothetical protein